MPACAPPSSAGPAHARRVQGAANVKPQRPRTNRERRRMWELLSPVRARPTRVPRVPRNRPNPSREQCLGLSVTRRPGPAEMKEGTTPRPFRDEADSAAPPCAAPRRRRATTLPGVRPPDTFPRIGITPGILATKRPGATPTPSPPPPAEAIWQRDLRWARGCWQGRVALVLEELRPACAGMIPPARSREEKPSDPEQVVSPAPAVRARRRRREGRKLLWNARFGTGHRPKEGRGLSRQAWAIPPQRLGAGRRHRPAGRRVPLGNREDEPPPRPGSRARRRGRWPAPGCRWPSPRSPPGPATPAHSDGNSTARLTLYDSSYRRCGKNACVSHSLCAHFPVPIFPPRDEPSRRDRKPWRDVSSSSIRL